jgi:hypothetical protein
MGPRSEGLRSSTVAWNEKRSALAVEKRPTKAMHSPQQASARQNSNHLTAAKGSSRGTLHLAEVSPQNAEAATETTGQLQSKTWTQSSATMMGNN